jgi:hypothetical protein
MLALGATPTRAIIGGSLEQITHATARGDHHRDMLTHLGTFEPGLPEAQAEQWILKAGSDPVALLRVLDSFVDTPIEALGRITVPTLVLAGEGERGRGLHRCPRRGDPRQPSAVTGRRLHQGSALPAARGRVRRVLRVGHATYHTTDRAVVALHVELLDRSPLAKTDRYG